MNLLVRSGKSWSGHERNCCFLNTQGQRFATASAVAGVDFPDDARGLAVVDWDHDGRLDVWMTNRTAPRLRMLKNQWNSNGNFLAIKLNGVECNRDAIGARVELFLGKKGDTNRIKTLRAGEGFISQSSKWVHFGLGEEETIHHLVVRWPGGEAEEFTGVEANQRYLIEQGSGRATPWSTSRPPPVLRASPVELPQPTAEARVVAVSRPPVPNFSYSDFDGQTVEVFKEQTSQGSRTHEGPLLINLWASWCSPCQRELKDFADNERPLRQAGLRVVALSIDGSTDETPNPAQLKETIDRTRFPFEAGLAPQRLLYQLDAMHRSLVDLQEDLPVPCSFLIDSKQRLAILYKGRVSAEQLLGDLEILDASPERLRDLAVPFAGTWISKPIGAYPQDIALKFLEQGRNDEAIRYLRHHLASASGNVDSVTADLADAYFLLGRLLYDQRKIDEAMEAYGEALRLNPGYRKAHVNLGEIFLRQNKPAKAVEHFEAGLKIEPDDPEVLVALGVALLQLRRYDETARRYQEAIRLRPGYTAARSNLARLLHARGDLKGAIREYREVLRIRPDSPSDANNLAWILATASDESIHNPQEAAELAKQACDATKHQDLRFLTTLAVAYSELGRFEDAVISAKTAIRLAHAAGQPEAAAIVEKHLKLYEAKTGFREGSTPP